MKHISFYNVKGGQGTTVTAARVAARLANSGHRVLFVSDDAAVVYGMPEPPAGEITEAGDNLSMFDATTWQSITAPDGLAIFEPFDVIIHDWDKPGAFRVLVTRSCYMALRQAVTKNDTPDLIAVLMEVGRALTVRDVERAIGAPAIQVDVTPTVARAVDAGLLCHRPEVDERINNLINQLPIKEAECTTPK